MNTPGMYTRLAGYSPAVFSPFVAAPDRLVGGGYFTERSGTERN